jgi:uncharacterized protein (TIGR02453 family)
VASKKKRAKSKVAKKKVSLRKKPAARKKTVARKATKKPARSRQAHFTPGLFDFLKELANNNNREWFTENKERYETVVKAPFLDFISDFGARLATISKHLVADPRPIGGSMFRVYRDTRFSKDKTPYKTHASAHFQHEGMSGGPRNETVHTPGFYLHLEPGNVFLAGGLWRPPAPIANLVRRRIDENRAEWRHAVSRLKLEGESLVRPPPGFDTEHPLLVDLKRKDFIATTYFTEKDAVSPSFIDDIADACRLKSPMMGILTRTVGFPY